MSKKFLSVTISRVLVVCLAAATLTMAQKPKSQKEVDALMAIQNATTSDARMSAVDALIEKFADTEFKVWALNIGADAAHVKGDSAKAVFYAERALEADKKDYTAMLLLAGELAQHTREFDLDRDEKLAKAEKYIHDAFPLIEAAPKPNPQITDEQWAGAKKDYAAQGHETLGVVASVRKKMDVAVTEFKTAVDLSPDPATLVRLAGAYNESGKFDDALTTVSRVLAMADIPPVIKQFANNEKAKAEKAKAAAK